MASKLLSDDFLNLICLDFSCQTAEEAIRQAGNLLLENQYITGDYIDGMLNREKEHPTYLDYGVMIPHGTQDTLSCVLRPGISIVFIPKGFLYLGHTVSFVIGISSKEEDPLQELMQITDILLEPEKRIRLLNPSSKQEIIDVINENYFEKGEL